ncbi:hypothetical protein [Aquicella lusitana]|uniref:Uncharacterized protein n=1 Tax=Aquicella lusitana TaxID=254246 RepID=A0A370GYF2_9COXI|nr:hypothetical protein [Aquicella lusitana]RDI48678.1 hypothetical protein C8D86_102107 [Aquicella lusitana]VVC73945.1 hypothetical protein AQULUS_17060 [Aquicella lusitana]
MKSIREASDNLTDLKTDCRKYQRHLLNKIASLAEKLPVPILNEYIIRAEHQKNICRSVKRLDGAVDTDKIIHIANTGGNLAHLLGFPSSAFDYLPGSKTHYINYLDYTEACSPKNHAKLYAAIMKYNEITRIIDALENNLPLFKMTINDPNIQAILKIHRDSPYLKFASDIFGIDKSSLSGYGLTDSANNATRFWKSKGHKLLEKLQKTMTEIESPETIYKPLP